MESGPEHPISKRMRAYDCVGMEAFREPGERSVLLRLMFRHPASGAIRRFEFSLPGDEELRIVTAFSFLFKRVSFLDHSADQWEGREIEIRFGGIEANGIEFGDNDFPGPLYADWAREVRAQTGRKRLQRKKAGSGQATSGKTGLGRKRRPGQRKEREV